MSLYDRLFAHQGQSRIDISEFANALNANGQDMITQSEVETTFSLTTAESNQFGELVSCVFSDPPLIGLMAMESALWTGYFGIKTETEVRAIIDPLGTTLVS